MGQNIRQTSAGHLDIEVFKELADLRLAHIAAVFERHDQSSQARAEVAMIVTGGQRSPVRFLLPRRVVNVPLELSIPGLDFDILHDHDFILQSHRIGRQRGGIYGTFHRLVDGEILERTSVVCPAIRLVLGLPPFFRRVIRIRMVVVSGSIVILLTAVACVFGFLFLFELFSQAFDFVSERILVRTECLDHVEQFLNRQLSLFR